MLVGIVQFIRATKEQKGGKRAKFALSDLGHQPAFLILRDLDWDLNHLSHPTHFPN
jgi:hypothetical protein